MNRLNFKNIINIALISLYFTHIVYGKLPVTRDYCQQSWVKDSFNCEECEGLWSSTTRDILSGDYEEFMQAVVPFFNASNIMYDDM